MNGKKLLVMSIEVFYSN